MKLAISLLTRDRMELTAQSLPPLLDAARAGKFHLFVMDGSTSEENEEALWELAYPTATVRSNVRGGAGAAIVFALTEMLNHAENYTHVGLLENDVLLHDGWLAVLDLFSLGASDGLEVGAASARCFVDRVLFQRDGFAVMHNLGAGCIVLTRRAAQIILDTFRTGWTTDNRRVFAQLSGIDIGHYWAFRGGENALTADWHWDVALAAHGLASVALTPSPVTMIGQVPPLHEQGLHIADGEVATNPGFNRFVETTQQIRDGNFIVGTSTKFQFSTMGAWTYFPHQMHMLGGSYSGDWRLRELRGWGTFGWEVGEGGTTLYMENGGVESFNAFLVVPALGPVSVLASGGKFGGKIEIADEQSGFVARPELSPEGDNWQVLQVQVPGGINYRNIRITALTPGVTFYGLQTREQQSYLPNALFDFSVLPPP